MKEERLKALPDECVCLVSLLVFSYLSLFLPEKRRKKLSWCDFSCHLWKYKAKLPCVLPVNVASKARFVWRRDQWLGVRRASQSNWNEAHRKPAGFTALCLLCPLKLSPVIRQRHETPALVTLKKFSRKISTDYLISISPPTSLPVTTLSSPTFFPPSNLQIAAEFSELPLFLQFIFSVWSSL